MGLFGWFLSLVVVAAVGWVARGKFAPPEPTALVRVTPRQPIPGAERAPLSTALPPGVAVTPSIRVEAYRRDEGGKSVPMELSFTGRSTHKDMEAAGRTIMPPKREAVHEEAEVVHLPPFTARQVEEVPGRSMIVGRAANISLVRGGAYPDVHRALFEISYDKIGGHFCLSNKRGVEAEQFLMYEDGGTLTLLTPAQDAVRISGKVTIWSSLDGKTRSSVFFVVTPC